MVSRTLKTILQQWYCKLKLSLKKIFTWYSITGSNWVYNGSYTCLGKWKGHHILQHCSQLYDEILVSDCFRESNKEILITESALVKAIICTLVCLPPDIAGLQTQRIEHDRGFQRINASLMKTEQKVIKSL